MQDEKNVGPGITEDIRKLLKDKEVIHVIKGDEVVGSLDENAIRNNILIHTYIPTRILRLVCLFRLIHLFLEL